MIFEDGLTHARGKITAQSTPGIRQPGGTREVERIIIPTIIAKHSPRASQKRLTILGTSIQKFDLSTS